ncbi:MAG TPA: hypothetical protein PLQ76_07930, partial [bacterium]|nr:hypothetical protein [bacterium]
MYRRLSLTLLWLTALPLAALGLSVLPNLLFWQCLVILLPAAMLMIGLAWTRPYPDFSAPDTIESTPIEDLSNPTRKVLWLNGPWEFRLDKEQRTRRIDVPRPWNTIRGLEYYNGAAVYRRLVKIPQAWSQGKIFLRCRGVNYRSVLSIDGRQIGSHEGGFTTFDFDLTEQLSDCGEHEIEMKVDNTLSATTVPNVVCWNNDGGIHREIYLETRNQVHINDAYILTDPDLKGRADIALMVKIHNPRLISHDYKIEIFSPQGALIHEYTIEGWTMQTLQHRIQLNFVSLWSPDNPVQYKCRIQVCEEGGDERSFLFGIRKIEISPDEG